MQPGQRLGDTISECRPKLSLLLWIGEIRIHEWTGVIQHQMIAPPDQSK